MFLILLSGEIKSQWCFFTNVESSMNMWHEDTVTDTNQQLCNVAPCLQKLPHFFQSSPHAGVVETAIPPSNVSPIGLLIRSNHTVAHNLELLYLHLNHLITPFSISPHNWMKRRNRSVTLACPTFVSCLTSVLAAVGRRKHQHLC